VSTVINVQNISLYTC